MEKLEDFNNEIVNNFSELFVSTYLIRYLSDFDKNQLLDNTRNIYELLIKNLKLEFIRELENMGYENIF